MERSIFFKLIIVFISAIIISCQSNKMNKLFDEQERVKEPVSIIFDTDIGPDYDDVGAMAVLHSLADKGEANILATISSNKYEGVASVLNLINTYFKRPEIPIGIASGKAVNEKDWQSWSDSLRIKYPYTINSNAEVEEAIALYRKIITEQPDKSVTVVTIGFLTNMADLLNSLPDQYSDLDGRELVKRKVKVLVCMAGKFPSGKEFNIYKDAKSGQETFEKWPTEIIFSGYEIGEKIKTGIHLINNSKIKNSPVKDAYSISISQSGEDKYGRMSWDQTAVLVAIKGADPYYELIPGKIITEEDGSNTWDNTAFGHYYLKEKMPVEKVTALIDELMQHEPEGSIY
jgi:pyrimidine-specific ribonucleoside hydrolase